MVGCLATLGAGGLWGSPSYAQVGKTRLLRQARFTIPDVTLSVKAARLIDSKTARCFSCPQLYPWLSAYQAPVVVRGSARY